MAESNALAMDEEELVELLGRGGTGVLSFSTDGGTPPYSLPVSYGFNETSMDFYFRLAVPGGAGKADVLDEPVSFVAFERTDAGWRSAVATGRLEEVTEADYDSSALQGMWLVEIPIVDIFERDPKEVAFRYFRLDPERLSGRKEAKAGY